MTVANIIFEPNQVRLITDTVGYRGKSPASFHRKVWPVAHARLAFVVRGYRDLAEDLHDRAGQWSNFQTCVSDLATTLKTVPTRLLQSGNSEITILGWEQDRRGPMVSRLLVREFQGDIVIRRFDLAWGVYLAPSLGTHQFPAGLTDDQICKIARLQQDISLRHGLNLCVGGDIEVTTIDAQAVTVRKIGEYPDKAVTAARIAQADSDDRDSVAA